MSAADTDAPTKRKPYRHKLTPGRAIYLLRSSFQHGLKTAFYRDIVRPQIIRSTPVIETNDNSCEIHVLTSHSDWLNLIWVLKSLYQFEECRFNLCIHEDGTVPEEGLAHLSRLFPNARLIRREVADEKLKVELQAYPLSHQFRFNNPFSLKVFDFNSFLENDKMFLLDSDILFYSPPQAILERIHDASFTLNSLNKDWDYGYSIPQESLEQQCDFDIESKINSGLGLVHRTSIRLDWIEEFLSFPGILDYRHRIEQTLIALCSCRFGYEMLPQPYDVSLDKTDFSLPCKHYTSPIRQLMYSEGVKSLHRRLI